jgi:hypothetical protein
MVPTIPSFGSGNIPQTSPEGQPTLRALYKSVNPLVPLPRELKGGIKAEVCYLPSEVHVYEMDSRENRERTVNQDLLLIRHVRQMMEQSEPMGMSRSLLVTPTLLV